MISETIELPPVERRLLEQYFNTYCRETACFDPRLDASDAGPAALRAQIASWRAAGLEPYALTFAADGRQLVGALTDFSPIGYHRVSGIAWLGHRSEWRLLTDATQLVDLIAASLGAASGLPVQAAAQRRERLAALMHDSIDKVRLYHGHPAVRHPTPFVAAEQGLRFGHVFHVTSKASKGFDRADLHRYAPELGASFRLHYFAVAADLLEVQRAGSTLPLPTDPHAAECARDLIADADYRLLPAHPWQARYLLRQPQFAALVDKGCIVSLGALGETAWPTSSVRTVWLPEQRVFAKLPLNVRITNFVRNNPPDQVRRALDASRALAWLPNGAECGAFCALRELGSLALAVPGEPLRAASAVIYRQALPIEEIAQVQVVAAIAEESADGTTPLARLLQQAAGGQAPTSELVRTWWARYLQVTLLPMLRLFCDHGISLEAHLQNAMVRFRNGWPVRGYARDMEGTSISAQRFAYRDRLDPDSPVLYADAQAWHRFKYYVLVNHIGHMAACLGRTGLATEAALWEIIVQALSSVRDPLVVQLLDSPTLPAKANMLSSFHQHGERPSWIDIPNPACRRR